MSVEAFKTRLARAGFPAVSASVSRLPRGESAISLFRRAILPAQARALCPTADVLAACARIEGGDSTPDAARALMRALLAAEGKPGCPAYEQRTAVNELGQTFTYEVLPIEGLVSAAAWAATDPDDTVRAAENAASAFASLGSGRITAAVAELNAEVAKERGGP